MMTSLSLQQQNHTSQMAMADCNNVTSYVNQLAATLPLHNDSEQVVHLFTPPHHCHSIIQRAGILWLE